MQIDSLLFARQDDGDCIGPNDCPEPQPCNCAANQDCIIINRDCHTCSQTTCVAASGSSQSSGGVSKGALAGGIVGAVVFFALAISLYFWYRRKSHLRRIMVHAREVQKDIPAPAADVLNRPDPTEKLSTISPRQSALPGTSEHADLESHDTSLPAPTRPYGVNPFDDSNSIQTTKTEGPNVIPIALVHPQSGGSRTDTDTVASTDVSTASSGPLRPPRSPDLNLNLEHVNVSNDNLRQYANSTISGFSAVSRNSYMSGASYSSDFLNEAPVIVTANKGVRQVINVAKAEVLPAGNIPSPSESSLKVPSFVSRPTITSPLAATSFGPNDVLRETDENEAANPFEDNHSTTAQGSTSPATSKFDPTSPRPESTNSQWVPDGPSLPWARSDDSRPSSISTQGGSVVNIGSVTRVNVGLASPSTASSFPRAYRTTMGRLVSPLSGGSSPQPGTLQEQQARAYAQAQGSKRISGSSVVSAASTRADSILEAFPFVPPSPISDRPIRSPPVSPLTKQSFTSAAKLSPPQSPASPASPARSFAQQQPIVTVAPASPLSQRDFNVIPASSGLADNEALPTPPDRRTLGMSTGSQLSTTSTGLGQFPFQIDTGSNSDGNSSSSRPTTLNVRQRASLDTLALTSDLASYPLDFERERDSVPPPPLPRQL